MQNNDQELTLLARCFPGLEEPLARELEKLGADEITLYQRAVGFTGNKKLSYQANLALRTALDVNLLLFKNSARDEKQYYRVLRDYAWEVLLEKGVDIYISITGKSSFSTHTLFLAQKAKDAIADRMRDRTGERPSVGKAENSLSFNIYFRGDEMSVFVNTSGEPLFKRGYRDAGSRNRAPLNESLAAGLIYLSGWDPQLPFLDLMCGSGTLAIEAALIRLDIWPNQHRKHFSFMNLPDFDKKLWEESKHHPENPIQSEEPIIGADVSMNNIKKARRNVAEARVDKEVQLIIKDIREMQPPEGSPGTIILNPPYGERMEKDPDLDQLYKDIGTAFKHNFPGYTAWIFTANLEALNEVGLRPFRRFKLHNGALDCLLAGYKMYSGTKKIHKLNEPSV